MNEAPLHKMNKKEREFVRAQLAALFAAGIPVKVKKGVDLLVPPEDREPISKLGLQYVSARFEAADCGEGVLAKIYVRGSRRPDDTKTEVTVEHELNFKDVSRGISKKVQEGEQFLYHIDQ